mmetsp:Transcript_13922/g.43843  ORF Transcript_13922/g.43843 Transcript_13922/m.43843 type:complete len:230 (+) Transcript_13922:1836-2525(+)
MLAKGRVAHERQVRRQHENLSRRFVLVLLWAIPLATAEAARHEVAKVLIVKAQRGRRPRTVVARPNGVSTAQGMATRQRNNLFVGKAHTIGKDGAEMIGTLASVGQATRLYAFATVGRVGATETKGDTRTTKEFNDEATCQAVQVGMADLGKLTGDRNEQIVNNVETLIGRIGTFRCEANTGTVTSAGSTFFAKCSRHVPRISHGDRACVHLVVNQCRANRTLYGVKIH